MGLRISEAFVLIFICLLTLCALVNLTTSDGSPASTGTLSRKKRYLTFPSGSILQLGYCLNVPAIIPDGIWFYGITFGTNWEIPTDPVGLKVPKDAEVVHRRQRRDLYQKLVPMMDMMGLDGNSCILRALCESGQRPKGAKGSFIEEILHIIFTLPRNKLSRDSADEDLMKYDAAYKTKADCAALFPSCLKDLDVS